MIKIGGVIQLGYLNENTIPYLKEIYDIIDKNYPNEKKEIVLNQSWQSVAHKEAISRKWDIVDIVNCGNDWDSEIFLNYIDILIRIGRDDQLQTIVEKFKKTGKPIYEYPILNIYQMYDKNNYQFGYYVIRHSWSTIIAKIIGIDGVKEGLKIDGNPPYYKKQKVYAELYRVLNNKIDYAYKLCNTEHRIGKKRRISCPGTYSYTMVK